MDAFTSSLVAAGVVSLLLACGIARSLKPVGFVLALPIVILLLPLFVVVALVGACGSGWHRRVTLPRLLARLDRINEEEGDPAPEVTRLEGLVPWVGRPALETPLLTLLDVEGPCRPEALRLLGEGAPPSAAVRERVQALAEEPDPLAPTARDILARWDANGS